jgi:uncharacterized RDD family membrane protein YckC
MPDEGDDRARADETIGVGPRQAVRAPEQVWLELAIAGPTSRMLAYAADYVLIVALELGLVVVFVLAVPVLASRPLAWLRAALSSLDPTGRVGEALLLLVALAVIGQLVVEWGYFVFWELVANGRSPGKRLVGLRVVRDDGFPIGVRDSLVRNLLRAVDLLPWYYAVGLIAMLVSSQGKRLGDLAAGTLVVRLDRPEAAPPLAAEDPDAGGFRFSRDQLMRLGTDELALLRQTLRRLDALPPARAAEALDRAVTVLATRIGYGSVAPEERHAFLRALLHAARPH